MWWCNVRTRMRRSVVRPDVGPGGLLRDGGPGVPSDPGTRPSSGACRGRGGLRASPGRHCGSLTSALRDGPRRRRLLRTCRASSRSASHRAGTGGGGSWCPGAGTGPALGSCRGHRPVAARPPTARARRPRPPGGKEGERARAPDLLPGLRHPRLASWGGFRAGLRTELRAAALLAPPGGRRSAVGPCCQGRRRGGESRTGREHPGLGVGSPSPRKLPAGRRRTARSPTIGSKEFGVPVPFGLGPTRW